MKVTSTTSTGKSQPHELSRTYIYRKHEKPLVEKRRRQRINDCLSQLRDIIIQVNGQHGQTESEELKKLEKAEILEMTVRQLKRLRMMQTDNSQRHLSSYRAGYQACMDEVRRTLSHSYADSAALNRLQDRLNQSAGPSTDNNINRGVVIPCAVSATNMAPRTNLMSRINGLTNATTTNQNQQRNMDYPRWNVNSVSTLSSAPSRSLCVSPQMVYPDIPLKVSVNVPRNINNNIELPVKQECQSPASTGSDMWRPW